MKSLFRLFTLVTALLLMTIGFCSPGATHKKTADIIEWQFCMEDPSNIDQANFEVQTNLASTQERLCLSTNHLLLPLDNFAELPSKTTIKLYHKYTAFLEAGKKLEYLNSYTRQTNINLHCRSNC